MTDLITMQIIRNRISTLMDEMDHSIFRSGYSTIVRESHDFSVIITDHEGRLLIAPRMFLHSFTYYHFVQTLVRIYGADGCAEGDVFVSNHPYHGGVTHVPDMATLAPIFHQGRMIGFCGAMAHKADFGGTVPGSTYGKAISMYPRGDDDSAGPAIPQTECSIATWSASSKPIPASRSWCWAICARRSVRPSRVASACSECATSSARMSWWRRCSGCCAPRPWNSAKSSVHCRTERGRSKGSWTVTASRSMSPSAFA